MQMTLLRYSYILASIHSHWTTAFEYSYSVMYPSTQRVLQPFHPPQSRPVPTSSPRTPTPAPGAHEPTSVCGFACWGTCPRNGVTRLVALCVWRLSERHAFRVRPHVVRGRALLLFMAACCPVCG